MEQPTPTIQTTRKTSHYQLKPTPEQERALEEVLWRCRTLDTCALEQRLTWWRRGTGRSVSRFQQEAEWKDLRAAFPAYAALHRPVLQDVLARRDTTAHACFRRRAAGEKAGFPRLQGRDRSHRFTSKEYGNGARLDTGFLVLSTIGRLAVRWSRPRVGTPTTVTPTTGTISREADGWYVSCSCAQVPLQPLPLTGRETGIDVGRKVFLLTAQGKAVENPRHYRKAEQALAKAQKRLSRRTKRSTRWYKAARV